VHAGKGRGKAAQRFRVMCWDSVHAWLVQYSLGWIASAGKQWSTEQTRGDGTEHYVLVYPEKRIDKSMHASREKKWKRVRGERVRDWVLRWCVCPMKLQRETNKKEIGKWKWDPNKNARSILRN
jgi:hypothetical protein